MCLPNMFSWFDVSCFDVFNRKTVSTDLTKPLIIPAGSDSFSQIGNLTVEIASMCQQRSNSAPMSGSPCTTDVDIASLHAKTPKDLWKKVCGRVFPQEVGQRGGHCV